MNRHDVTDAARKVIVYAMVSMLSEPSYAINPSMRENSKILLEKKLHLNALEDIN